MVDIENRHLRCAAGLAARLDDTGPGIESLHERYWPRGRTASCEVFFLGPEIREIRPGSRAPLEDEGLSHLQFSDGLHVILDRLDETCRDLGQRVFHAEIEPDGRVERAFLSEEQYHQIVAKALGVLGSLEVLLDNDEVPDRIYDTLYDLADTRLTFRCAQAT